MTISPQDLTAEERAIWDALAIREFPSFGATHAYAQTKGAMECVILARRALFTPESEKPAQPETKYQPVAASVALAGVGVSAKGAGRRTARTIAEIEVTPAPVAAGPVMSEELTLVLFVAMHTVNHDKGWSPDYAEKVREAVAAVRAQAAAAGSDKDVEIEALRAKVRELEER